MNPQIAFLDGLVSSSPMAGRMAGAGAREAETRFSRMVGSTTPRRDAHMGKRALADPSPI